MAMAITLSCRRRHALIKAVIVPALALGLWWLVHSDRARRGRILTAHLVVIAGLTLASVLPFLAGWHTLAPFATLGGVEAWASPSHPSGVRSGIVGVVQPDRVPAPAAGPSRLHSCWCSSFSWGVWPIGPARSDTAAPADSLGVTLLLLALSMPYLLPWYAAWFAPSRTPRGRRAALSGCARDRRPRSDPDSRRSLLRINLARCVLRGPLRGRLGAPRRAWGRGVVLRSGSSGGGERVPASDGYEVARSSAASASAPRYARPFVALFLATLAVCALATVNAWPFSSWELFSQLRTDQQTGWAAASIDPAGRERTIRVASLPLATGVRSATPGFRRSAAERDAICAAWL